MSRVSPALSGNEMSLALWQHQSSEAALSGGPVPTGSAVTLCARCQRTRGASTGMPVLALWGRESRRQPIMMTETPRPWRSTQGSIGVRECHERVAQATCTGLSGHRLVLVEL